MPCALNPGSIDEVERLLVNVVSTAMQRAETIKEEGAWKEMAEQVFDIQAKLSQQDRLASWVTHAEQKPSSFMQLAYRRDFKLQHEALL
eukprot:1909646-Amphidinium_carterae.1